MQVTFFIQAYNTERLVGECLDSVLGQRGAWDFDVLVIDDASTDGTAREIERFSDPRLRVVRHAKNTGAIATANEGYAASTGEFVVRVDSDDRLRPEFLRAAPCRRWPRRRASGWPTETSRRSTIAVQSPAKAAWSAASGGRLGRRILSAAGRELHSGAVNACPALCTRAAPADPDALPLPRLVSHDGHSRGVGRPSTSTMCSPTTACMPATCTWRWFAIAPANEPAAKSSIG